MLTAKQKAKLAEDELAAKEKKEIQFTTDIRRTILAKTNVDTEGVKLVFDNEVFLKSDIMAQRQTAKTLESLRAQLPKRIRKDNYYLLKKKETERKDKLYSKTTFVANAVQLSATEEPKIFETMVE